MPDDEPFDKAMREATERDWEASKPKPYQMTTAQRAAIRNAAAIESLTKDDAPAVKKSDHTSADSKIIPLFQRMLRPRMALAAAALLVGAVVLLSVAVPRPVELSMTVPTIKGDPPPTPSMFVNEAVDVSVNWKRGTSAFHSEQAESSMER